MLNNQPKTQKPNVLQINKDQSEMILKGLGLLSDNEKKNVNYISLVKDVAIISSMWDTVIRNQRSIIDTKRNFKKTSINSKN